jgi:hypothetical protein
MACAIQPCIGIIIKVVACIYMGSINPRSIVAGVNVSHSPAP